MKNATDHHRFAQNKTASAFHLCHLWLLLMFCGSAFGQSILRTPATTNSDPTVVAAWLGITGGVIGTNIYAWNINGNTITNLDADYAYDVGTKAAANFPTLQHYLQIISEGGPAIYFPNTNGWAYIGSPSTDYSTSRNWIENPQTAIGPVWIFSGMNNLIHDADVGTSPAFTSLTRFPYHGEFIMGGFSNTIQIAAGSTKSTNWFIGIVNGMVNKLDSSGRAMTNSIILNGRTNEIRGASESVIFSGVNTLITNDGVVVLADNRASQKRSTTNNQLILDFENGIILNGVAWTNGSGGTPAAGAYVLSAAGKATNLNSYGQLESGTPIRRITNVTNDYLTTTNDSMIVCWTNGASVTLTNYRSGSEVELVNATCTGDINCISSLVGGMNIKCAAGDTVYLFATNITAGQVVRLRYVSPPNVWYPLSGVGSGGGSGSAVKQSISYFGVTNAYIDFNYSAGSITLTNDVYFIPANLPGSDARPASYTLEIRQGTGGYVVYCNTNYFRFQGDTFSLFPNTTNAGYGDLWELRSWSRGTNVAVLQAIRFKL